MKKKKHRNKAKHGRRNAASAGASPKRSRWIGRGEAPDLWSTVASVAGGVGGAVISGMAVTTKALTEAEAGFALTGLGAGIAYFSDGRARIAANSAAAAGAGQLALHYMARRADKRKERDDKAKDDREKAEAEKIAQAVAAAQARQPALPAPATTAPTSGGLQNAADGGGYLADLFRGAADELDMLDEDDERNAEVNVFHVEDFAA